MLFLIGRAVSVSLAGTKKMCLLALGAFGVVKCTYLEGQNASRILFRKDGATRQKTDLDLLVFEIQKFYFVAHCFVFGLRRSMLLRWLFPR